LRQKPNQNARSSRAVPLNRAMSKLRIMSRAEATEAIRAGRVTVNGRPARDPTAGVTPERVRIEVDGIECRQQSEWRMILFHKPRGVVTTRRDPEGRRTIYDVLGRSADGLIPVGRLDLATSGLLLLTNDTRLAHRLTDPSFAVPRIYLVTVRGEVSSRDLGALHAGIISGDERLCPASIVLRKASGRESHLTVELKEGRNREVRRMFAAIDREVTRLVRVRFGPLELGSLQPGEWREVKAEELGGAGTAGRAGT
jgi:23S rRNA pseudouridine2605 synthase